MSLRSVRSAVIDPGILQVTDYPQVLSGNNLMVLDPHCKFDGGYSIVEESLSKAREDYADQLAAFDSVTEFNVLEDSFAGTIVRLPLRTPEQAKVTKVVPVDSANAAVSADDIRTLMNAFKDELKYSLLFLRHVTKVELFEITEGGMQSVFTAEANKDVEKKEEENPAFVTRRVTVHVQADVGDVVTQQWRLLHATSGSDEAAREVQRRLGKDYSESLKMNKLNPSVSLAIPINGDELFLGRLFTVLPLPIETGLPVHISCMFALTPDRASLKGNRSSVDQNLNTEYVPLSIRTNPSG